MQERSRKEKNILYIVVPCYNEEQVLAETSKRLKEKCEMLIHDGKIAKESRIVFVDDGSKDHTWNMIDEFHKMDSLRYSGSLLCILCIFPRSVSAHFVLSSDHGNDSGYLLHLDHSIPAVQCPDDLLNLLTYQTSYSPSLANPKTSRSNPARSFFISTQAKSCASIKFFTASP